MKTGAQILVSELNRHGIDRIFGYPGASILSVYDALYDYSAISHILTVDERGAIFMAEGYARATGKLGVCLATSGPGATNLITGIADAFSDSIPLLIITGNVSIDSLGHDSFQEVDTAGVTMPITKYNYIVKKIEDLASVLDEAIEIALSGRQGPVLIDIPSNIFDEKCGYIVPPIKKTTQPEVSDISEAVKLINESKRPLIYAGGGVISSETREFVLALSKKIKAPVGVSLRGIGAVSTDYERYIGVSTSLNSYTKDALQNADLLISLGARFSNKGTAKSMYSKSLKLVHFDIDRAEIDKIHQSDAYVLGDLRLSLPRVLESVLEKSDDWFTKNCENIDALPKHIEYIKCLNKHFGNNITVATDVGQHQLWVANYYNIDSPRAFLSSCGLGAMGFGLSASIGASMGTNKPVLLITGDGSFNMSSNELLTLKQYNLPITIVIFDNSSLGMIREAQRKFYHGHYIDCDLKNSVDYISLAKAYGIKGYKAENVAELQKILDNLDNEPTIIDLRLSKQNKSL